ncbi:10591_t:CDS:2, partial [Dentiscutata erythropus]
EYPQILAQNILNYEILLKFKDWTKENEIDIIRIIEQTSQTGKVISFLNLRQAHVLIKRKNQD